MSALPEHTGLLLAMDTDGDGFTVSVRALEAVIQVELDKLATSGPTITRYIPPSATIALAIAKLVAEVPAVPILFQVVPLFVLFCH